METSHVGEDVIHEPLETRWGIGEPLRHHQPLERPILGLVVLLQLRLLAS